MRTAVLLTGALRTIKKTIRFLKRNVLAVAGDIVDVYACLQNDTTQSTEEWRAWFEQEIGGYLRDMVWYSPADAQEWTALRERLLSSIPIDDSWKSYLRNSGSMIEYYQLYLAYLRMRAGECTVHSGRMYDYVIRARTDSIFAKPVDFHWLHWTVEDVVDRMQRVATALGRPVEDPSVFQLFMSTLWSDDVLVNAKEIMADNQPPPKPVIWVHPAEILEYVQRGAYLLTLRRNNLYVIRRSLFSLLPASLGLMYGTFRTPHSDDYWFNAEGQFRGVCYEAGLAVYDYSTVFEEKSLEYAHAWQEDLFFNADGELRRSDMLYCVVRK